MKKGKLVVAIALIISGLCIIASIVIYNWDHDDMTHLQLLKMFWGQYLLAFSMMGIGQAILVNITK